MVPFPKSSILLLILQHISDRLMSSFLFASKSCLNSFQRLRMSPSYDLVGFEKRAIVNIACKLLTLHHEHPNEKKQKRDSFCNFVDECLQTEIKGRVHSRDFSLR